jgi:hypothetical protein
MAVVMNCLDEEQTAVVGGAHFTFKPRQIKHIYQESIAGLLTSEKKEYGFVSLPEEILDKEFADSPAGKAILEAKRKEGVDAFCKKLRSQLYNLNVSLKQDLDKSNLKVDPRVFASEGDIKAMELLAKYQSRKEDEDQKKVDRIKELEKVLNGKG